MQQRRSDWREEDSEGRGYRGQREDWHGEPRSSQERGYRGEEGWRGEHREEMYPRSERGSARSEGRYEDRPYGGERSYGERERSYGERSGDWQGGGSYGGGGYGGWGSSGHGSSGGYGGTWAGGGYGSPGYGGGYSSLGYGGSMGSGQGGYGGSSGYGGQRDYGGSWGQGGSSYGRGGGSQWRQGESGGSWTGREGDFEGRGSWDPSRTASGEQWRDRDELGRSRSWSMGSPAGSYRGDWGSESHRGSWRAGDAGQGMGDWSQGSWGRSQGTMTPSRSRRNRGPRNYQRSDERVREDVCDRLSDMDMEVDEVEVKVSGGEVTLTGTIESGAARREIERVAETVPGVKDVNNQLRVKRDTGDGSESSTGDRQGTSSTMHSSSQQPRTQGSTSSSSQARNV